MPCRCSRNGGEGWNVTKWLWFVTYRGFSSWASSATTHRGEKAGLCSSIVCPLRIKENVESKMTRVINGSYRVCYVNESDVHACL
jgi:hypothetical protein